MNTTYENALKSNKEALEQARALFADLKSELSASELENTVDALYQERVRMLESAYNSAMIGRVKNEWSYHMLKRRKAAGIEIAKEASAKYQDKYPDISVILEFVRINAPGTLPTFDELNRKQHIEMATALWMLDHLRSTDSLDDALPYFPNTREALNTVQLPNLSDSVHNDDLIRGMLYVIRNRNRGTEGFDPEMSLFDEADTGYLHTQDQASTQDMENFQSIMQLISPDVREQAKERFIKCFWMITDRLLAELTQLHSDAYALNEKKIGLLERQIDEIQRVNSEITSPLIVTDQNNSNIHQALNDIAADHNKLKEIDSQLEEMLQKIDAARTSDTLISDHQALLPDNIDPYEVCFAFLELLSSNSDYIWNYHISYIVLALAACQLPWTGYSGMDQESADNEAITNPALIDALAAYQNDPEMTDLNSIVYQEYFRVPNDQTDTVRISFQKLICMIGGLIPPRRSVELPYLKLLLQAEELSPGEIEALYQYLMLVYAIDQKDAEYIFTEDDVDHSDISESTDIAETEQEHKNLKRANKSLRSLVNQLEHKVKDLTEELRLTGIKADKYAAELAELRSMIHETDNTDTAYTVDISFPYRSTKRAVIFGGHESWVKAMKQLLPNARFFSPSDAPNPSVIMSAEIIWLQTNAMGHSYYYKIMDIVRTHHIPLEYFQYSSAEKCAEQFALKDMEE